MRTNIPTAAFPCKFKKVIYFQISRPNPRGTVWVCEPASSLHTLRTRLATRWNVHNFCRRHSIYSLKGRQRGKCFPLRIGLLVFWHNSFIHSRESGSEISVTVTRSGSRLVQWMLCTSKTGMAIIISGWSDTDDGRRGVLWKSNF